MRVLVCGSRYWGVIPEGPTVVQVNNALREQDILNAVLSNENENQPFTVLIEGEAPGADSFARIWAAANIVQVEMYPADWKKYGRAAGPIRNQQMLDEGKPDFVIAFTHDIEKSRGTRNMVGIARAVDIPVRIVGDDSYEDEDDYDYIMRELE